ncbi:MAG: hypothetical protein ACFE95_00085 [Candidatus Hodarchaeota archaeon]
MISNFQRQTRQFKLWQFIDTSLAHQDMILQSDVLSFTEKHNLGSKKTVLTMLNEFIENKMIEELELPPKGPGRPRKAYSLPQGKREDEPVLINLGQLPVPLYSFIQEQSTTRKQGKSEVITQLLSWAFLQYQSALYEMNQLKEPLPPHLKSSELNRDSLRSI